MSRVFASAPGKINLALLVGPPDSTGYHPLTSVFMGVSLREYVELRQLPKGARPGVEVRTLAYEQMPGGEQSHRQEPFSFSESKTALLGSLDGPQHLGVRAVELLMPEGASAVLTVHKTLPIAGGMAGGSADAAAALVAANELFGAQLSQARLEELGRTLGADVPACLLGGVSLGLGRGDRMELVREGTSRPNADSSWWVAAFADEGLSTPEVFRCFDQLGLKTKKHLVAESCQPGSETWSPGISAPEGLVEGLGGLRLDKELLVNDLDEAARTLRPSLGAVAADLERLGATATLLSGSGPTMLALVEGPQQGRSIAHAILGTPGIREASVLWGPAQAAQLESELPAWTIPLG